MGSQFDALNAALKANPVAPAPAQDPSLGEKIWNTAGNVAEDVVDNVGYVMKTGVDAVAAAPEALRNASQWSAEAQMKNPAAPMPFAQGIELGRLTKTALTDWVEHTTTQEKLEAAEGVIKGFGRIAVEVGGGIATGPLFPVGAAAAGFLFDKAVHLATGEYEKLPVTDADITKLRKDIVAIATPVYGAKAVGSTMNAVRDFFRISAEFPSASKVAIDRAGSPDGLTVAVGPTGTGAAANATRKALKEAQEVFIEESDNLFKNVDVKAVSAKNIKKDLVKANEQHLIFQDNVANRIKELKGQKDTLLRETDVAIQSAKGLPDSKLPADFGRIGINDLDLEEVQKLITRRDASLLTQNSSAEMQEILNRVWMDFSKNGKMGKVSLTQADDLLSDYYHALEKAKYFDAQVQAKVITDPGAIAANQNLTTTLRKLSGELKDTISIKAQQAIDLPELGLQRLAIKEAGPEGAVAWANRRIHGLLEFRDAHLMFADKSTEIMAKVNPVNRIVNEAGQDRGIWGSATKPIRDFVTGGRLEEAAAGRNTTMLGDLSLVAEVGKGNIGPASYRDFNVMGQLPQPAQVGVGVGIGGTRDDIQGAEEMLERHRKSILSSPSKAKKFGLKDLSIYTSARLDGDEVFIDDPNDQQDILAGFRNDPTIPPSHIALQASIFNSPTKQSKLLPVKKITEQFQPKPKIILNKPSANSTREYSY